MEVPIERHEYGREQDMRPNVVMPHVLKNEDKYQANGAVEHRKDPEPDPPPAINQEDAGHAAKENQPQNLPDRIVPPKGEVHDTPVQHDRSDDQADRIQQSILRFYADRKHRGLLRSSATLTL